MCSIAGSFSLHDTAAMLEVQKHRAPDQKGIITVSLNRSKELVIGMGRLSILDVEATNLCPYEHDKYILSYNGEVYNYKELRAELQFIGFDFTTNSDTEVVLKSYIAWGVDCFEKFNGMFALAIYDPVKQEIVLARDIAGQKPLFYRKGDFAFASEAKALVNNNTKLQEGEFYQTFQHIMHQTLYTNIDQLPAASYMRYNLKSNDYKIKYYWEFKPRYVNEATAEEELQYLLEDAVRLTKQSEVPVTLYYSGGVDSSLIAEAGDIRNHIMFREEDNKKEDFFANLKTIVKQLDFPVGSFSSYPLFAMAREAHKNGFKVVLSGEGADEVFGGYIRYVPEATNYNMRKRYPSYRDMFDKTWTADFTNITQRNSHYELIETLYKPLREKYDPITAMQLFDFTYILPSLLQMGDRMASLFGIENRCPFLDKRIIEFGLSLPPHLKISNLETKVLLRKLLAKSSFAEQKEKHGLIANYNKWVEVEGFDRTKYFNHLNKLWKKQNTLQ